MEARDERLTGGRAKSPGRGPAGRGPSRAASSVDQDDDLREYDERDDALPQEGDMDDERLMDALAAFDESVLPTLPDMPGYHVCWLTTTNSKDPVQRRQRMGYELITHDMIRKASGGDDSWSNLTTDSRPGVVSLNEMVAARIPLRLYQQIMQHFHHTKPMEDEKAIRANVQLAQERAEAAGARLVEGDGMQTLAQRVAVPVFAA